MSKIIVNMPTIILLDVSLSMSRVVQTGDPVEELTRRQIAISGINTFLDYLTVNCKMEFVSLAIFSSLYQQVVPFTRDYNEIKTALGSLEEYNKSSLESGLSGASLSIVEEWGASTQCQILLITDGRAGMGEGSLKHIVQSHSDPSHRESKYLVLPFKFPCKLHVVCIASMKDAEFSISGPLYKDLIQINDQGGELFAIDGPLSVKSAQQLFQNISETYFSPFVGLLKCGNLKCPVHIYPMLENYEKDHEFEHVKKVVSKEIEICGFLDIADVSSPPYVSRHLVLPMAVLSKTKSDVPQPDPGDGDDKSSHDKSAAFTVLLHGSLKVEGMVALVLISDDWYGIMYSFADSKKKSNLMLSVFQPGIDALPWLGRLDQLAPCSDFDPSPYIDNKSPFPVCPSERRSYSQNCVVWIQNTGLQADIQKILRNARKLPEKQLQFYKELNRLRKAALSIGFYELFDALAMLLDRECTMLASNTHPDAALQMTHAAAILRSPASRDVTQTIQPLQTNFTGD